MTFPGIQILMFKSASVEHIRFTLKVLVRQTHIIKDGWKKCKNKNIRYTYRYNCE